jgi:hypothetical protein
MLKIMPSMPLRSRTGRASRAGDFLGGTGLALGLLLVAACSDDQSAIGQACEDACETTQTLPCVENEPSCILQSKSNRTGVDGCSVEERALFDCAATRSIEAFECREGQPQLIAAACTEQRAPLQACVNGQQVEVDGSGSASGGLDAGSDVNVGNEGGSPLTPVETPVDMDASTPDPMGGQDVIIDDAARIKRARLEFFARSGHQNGNSLCPESASVAVVS